MRILRLTSLALLLGMILVSLPLVGSTSARPLVGPITLTAVTPGPNSTIGSLTPAIEATFSDTAAAVPYAGVAIWVDNRNVTGFQGTIITPSSVTYDVSSLFPLRAGDNNVTVYVTDTRGDSANLSWNFTINPNLPPPPSAPPIRFSTLLLYLAAGGGVAAAAFGGGVVYLRQTRHFTFRKYLITHPVQRSYVVLYVPLVVAFSFLVLGFYWVTSTAGLPAMAPDFILLVGIFLAITPFSIDAERELVRTRAYERAFGQFLFEMADAMRGGIDPAKAVIELSKTSANVLRRPLRVAADSLRIGRPFETVLREMVRPMGSPLVKRYAGLIADASGVGGETSLVVYRAAKDMDDFVKIEEERGKQLTLPVAVIYIAFAVLLAVLFALLYIAPSLGNLSIGFLGGGGNPLASSGSSTVSAVPKLDVATLHERFYQLMLINALGTGAIIGAFTEGRAKYGLLHSLGLAAATTIAFTLFVP